MIGIHGLELSPRLTTYYNDSEFWPALESWQVVPTPTSHLRNIHTNTIAYHSVLSATIDTFSSLDRWTHVKQHETYWKNKFWHLNYTKWRGNTVINTFYRVSYLKSQIVIKIWNIYPEPKGQLMVEIMRKLVTWNAGTILRFTVEKSWTSMIANLALRLHPNSG